MIHYIKLVTAGERVENRTTDARIIDQFIYAKI